jgi:hypothetical protein
VNTAGDAVNLIEGEETKRATRNALESVGYATGVVPGQVAQATQFLVDVAQGDQHPRDFWDWYEGLSTGKVKDQYFGKSERQYPVRQCRFPSKAPLRGHSRRTGRRPAFRSISKVRLQVRSLS